MTDQENKNLVVGVASELFIRRMAVKKCDQKTVEKAAQDALNAAVVFGDYALDFEKRFDVAISKINSKPKIVT